MKKNLLVSIGIFVKDIGPEAFKIWTQVREEAGSLHGKLEFPGGKIEFGETAEEACRREVHEEVGIEIPASDRLILFKYQDYSFENRRICLQVFISNFSDLPVEKGQWLDISYGEKSVFLEGKIPAINHVIIDELAVYIQNQYKAGCIDLLWQQ